MKRKQIFCAVAVIFFVANAMAEQPPVVALPVFPELKTESVLNKPLSSAGIRQPHLTWLLESQQGVQTIKRFVNRASEWQEDIDSSYPVNKYKGSLLTVNVAEVFQIRTDITVGFIQGEYPLTYSLFGTSEGYNRWSSMDLECVVEKTWPVTYRTKITPFAGYLFSQYNLQNLKTKDISDRREYHSIAAGVEMSFQPIRFFTVSGSLSFSPFTFTYGIQSPLVQINYQTILGFDTGFISLSGIFSARNTIGRTVDSLGPGLLRIFEAGIRFMIKK